MGRFRRIAGKIASAALVAAAMAALLLRPSDAIAYAKDGLVLCADVIVPSLFPFFVLSQMIVELGFARYVGAAFERVMRPLFNVSGSCATALALGFVGGYPTGARTAISLYEGGLCTKTEAERMLAFCNNSGPAFILGVVGAGVFASGSAGVLLYLAHAAASILVGVIFRFYKRDSGRSDHPASTAAVQSARLAPAFASSVGGALRSTLAICAFVVFFTVVIKMLYLTGAIPFAARLLARLPLLDEASAAQLLTGLVEISSGVWSLDSGGSMRRELALAAFMLGWAGLSVHCQVLSFIGRSGLSTRTYILGKLLHGVISAALVWCVAGLFGFARPVASYLAEQVAGAASLTLPTALLMSAGGAAVGAGGLWLGCILHRRRKKGL